MTCASSFPDTEEVTGLRDKATGRARRAVPSPKKGYGTAPTAPNGLPGGDCQDGGRAIGRPGRRERPALPAPQLPDNREMRRPAPGHSRRWNAAMTAGAG